MQTMTDRPRGVTLTVLDLAPLLTKIDLAEGETAALAFEPYAMADHGDALYVVCSEGVGWRVDSTAPLGVDVYVSTPGRMAIAPRFRMLLTPAEVRAHVTDQTVDLADLVRVFGGRLEANFRNWHQALTA